MKYFLISIILGYIPRLFAQDGEVSFLAGLGIPTHNFHLKPASNQLNDGALYSLADLQDLSIRYFTLDAKKTFVKRWNIHFNYGVERTNRIMEFLMIYKGFIYRSQKINSVGYEAYLGLGKSFQFWDKKLILDFNFNLNYRETKFATTTAITTGPIFNSNTSDSTSIESSVDIYWRNTKYFKFQQEPKLLNLEYSIHAKFKLRQQFYLNLGILFTKGYMNYSTYKYTIEQFDASGNAVFSSTNQLLGYDLNISNYLGFSLGLSYMFNYPKFKEKN